MATSLALALAGFSVDESDAAPGDEAGQPAPAAAPPPPLAATARERPPATAAAALVEHAHTLGRRVLQGWAAPGYDPEPDAEQLASLCFALQACVGRCRLGDSDERRLFDAAHSLWEASLQAAQAARGGTASGLSAALEGMAEGLWALVEDSSDGTADAAVYISAFSALAASWAKVAGQRERAKACLDRAMRYSQLASLDWWGVARQGPTAACIHRVPPSTHVPPRLPPPSPLVPPPLQLEAQVASEEVPRERKEGLVVALFSLYLEGAKAAAGSKQQVGGCWGRADAAQARWACRLSPRPRPHPCHAALLTGAGQQPAEPCGGPLAPRRRGPRRRRLLRAGGGGAAAAAGERDAGQGGPHHVRPGGGAA